MGLLLSLQGIFTPKISAKIHTRGAPNWRRTDYVCSNFREFQKLKKLNQKLFDMTSAPFWLLAFRPLL